MNSIYDIAIRTWIARQLTDGRYGVEHILEYKFDTIHDYAPCDTCGWDEYYPSISYHLKTSRLDQWREINLTYIPMAQVLEECMEIYRTLSRLPEYEQL